MAKQISFESLSLCIAIYDFLAGDLRRLAFTLELRHQLPLEDLARRSLREILNELYPAGQLLVIRRLPTDKLVDLGLSQS